MTAANQHADVAIIGTGIAGIATAYYLAQAAKRRSILLIDRAGPMSFTSAQSGDNYRNCWSHPTMKRFVDDSIDLMEDIAMQSGDALSFTRRGYIYATRRGEIDGRIAELEAVYGTTPADGVRLHTSAAAPGYRPSGAGDWRTAPAGVDVLANAKLLRRAFAALSGEIERVIHVRRAGDFSSRQMGGFMLKQAGSRGVKRLIGDVVGIDCGPRFALDVERPSGRLRVLADTLVNAAGPFAGSIAAMTGVELPITNVFQQKLAFEDTCGAVPRNLPLAIDIDARGLDWMAEERALLRSDPALEWLTDSMPGGVHCRPEGSGRRIKLGWAYNRLASEARRDLADEPGLHPHFAEIVLRRAAGLVPALAAYVDSPPARRSHYGGYYTMTPENWPLIGPAGP